MNIPFPNLSQWRAEKMTKTIGQLFMDDPKTRKVMKAMNDRRDREDKRRGWRIVFVEVAEVEYQAHLRELEERAAKMDGEPILKPGEAVRLPPTVEQQLPRMIMMREDIKTGARSPLWEPRK